MAPQSKDQLLTSENSLDEQHTSSYSDVNKRTSTFDFANVPFTQLACTSALLLGFVGSIVCIAYGAHIVSKNEPLQLIKPALSGSTTDVVLFAINVVLTLCTDGMNFIHATSLRWALYRENRLKFNTNIRLFTSARRSGPNRWYTNVVALASLILCYASTSQLLIQASCLEGFYREPQLVCTGVNGMALLTLGVGLLLQTVIGTWCLYSTSRYIHTWSSNPLVAAKATQDRYIQHREGRCMLSVEQSSLPSSPSLPQSKQSSAFHTKAAVRGVVVFVWILAILLCVWCIIIILVSQKVAPYTSGWVFTLSWSPQKFNGYYTAFNVLSLFINPSANSYRYQVVFPAGVQFLLAILFICLVQGLQTIGLHCVELLVNMSRDEAAWRSASVTPSRLFRSRTSGASLSQSSFAAAVLSWENVILFSLKAALHWLIGQSIKMVYTNPRDDINGVVSGNAMNNSSAVRFDMMYSRLLVSSLVAIFLAAFATYLSRRRPKGPQPATWGHLQTLADLVDDWKTSDEGRLWWGDKGIQFDGVRHAGTSGNYLDLGSIDMNALYAGLGPLHEDKDEE